MITVSPASGSFPSITLIGKTMLFFDKGRCPIGDVVIDGFHSIFGQWAGVLYSAVGIAVDYTPRSEFLMEAREFVFEGIIGVFRFLFGVQVIEVAVELVKISISIRNRYSAYPPSTLSMADFRFHLAVSSRHTR